MSTDRGTLLQQSAPLMIARGGAAMLAFALPLLLTRVLTVADYGTYKAAFLVIATAFALLQAGMAQSLYYFVPREAERRGTLLTNALLSLATTGAIGAIAIWLGGDLIAGVFGSRELAHAALPVAAICLLMTIGAPLEIFLVATGRVRQSAGVFFGSEVARLVASIAPLALGFGLRGLLWGNVAHGAARLIACGWLVSRSGGFRPSWQAAKRQFAYALPFAGAILALIPQQTFHQWAVGAQASPAEFAIYMVGCFQLPIVSLLYSPISDVLQVRLAGPDGRTRGAALFQEATTRLGAVFLPLCAFLIAAAAAFVPALFTHRYDQSVPVLQLAVLTVPFAALPVDGALRALGRTPFILRNAVVKLAVTVPAVLFGLRAAGILGAIAAHVVVEGIFRVSMLWPIASDLRVGMAALVPWRKLLLFAAASLAGAIPASAIASSAMAQARPMLALAASGVVFGAVYLCGLALGGGGGSAFARIKRALFGMPSSA